RPPDKSPMPSATSEEAAAAESWSNPVPDAIGSDPSSRQERPRGRSAVRTLLILTVLAIAVWVRWPRLSDGVWRDEAVSVYIASAPTPAVFWERYETGDYNPPLFNGLLSAWGSAFGFGEKSVKILGFGCGLLALLGIAALAGELFGFAGALAALLAANAHPILVEMSAELRA